MADFEMTNMRELDDQAARFGVGESQEARFANEALGCEGIGISLQRVKPGKRHAFGHRHADAEEVYVVLSGSGRVRLDDEIRDVKPLDAIRVAPHVMRAFEGGPEGLELLAFGTLAEDAEMDSAFWAD